MEIVETLNFTRRIQVLLTDDEYNLLQQELIKHPSKRVIIPGSGGIRKIRWSAGGRGKRGGIRVIYYWVVARDIILMLLVYPKNVKDDLTPPEIKVLRQIVEQEYP